MPCGKPAQKSNTRLEKRCHAKQLVSFEYSRLYELGTRTWLQGNSTTFSFSTKSSWHIEHGSSAHAKDSSNVGSPTALLARTSTSGKFSWIFFDVGLIVGCASFITRAAILSSHSWSKCGPMEILQCIYHKTKSERDQIANPVYVKQFHESIPTHLGPTTENAWTTPTSGPLGRLLSIWDPYKFNKSKTVN